MCTRLSNTLQVSRLRPLAACLVIAFSAEVVAGSGAADSSISSIHRDSVAPRRISNVVDLGATSRSLLGKSAGANPAQPGNVLTVKNCQDDGTDSLRAVISAAGEGDTIEFDPSQMQCGTITLTSGEIPIIRNNLTLRGPNAHEGAIAISGGGTSRVFEHVGSGTLEIYGLTISNGNYHAAGPAVGGCIKSAGSVFLDRAKVAGCTAVRDSGTAFGGGIYALQDVTMILSSVSANHAGGPSKRGYGGGIFAFHGDVLALYSSISGNVADDGAVGGWGGGADAAEGAMHIYGSTIDHNAASYASGLVFGRTTTIVDSTISENVAQNISAVYSRSGSLTIANSTIAFNHEDTDMLFGAVGFRGPSASDTITLQSSIIADNTSGAGNAPADLFVVPGPGVLFGAANLVMASNVWPPGVITVTADPKLGPLQLNGGGTLTHAPLSGSPALGLGNDNAMRSNDQRGVGYPRITGNGGNGTVDIGAVQFDTIFFGGFEFAN